jgi:hypothetical protein
VGVGWEGFGIGIVREEKYEKRYHDVIRGTVHYNHYYVKTLPFDPQCNVVEISSDPV